MSELFDKQVNAQKEKNFWGLPQAHERVCDENERKKESRRKKQHAHKNIFNGSEEFIRHLWKGHVMDINKLQVNDS